MQKRRGHGGDNWPRRQPGKCQILSFWKSCCNLHSLFLSQVLSFITPFPLLFICILLFIFPPLLTQAQASQLQINFQLTQGDTEVPRLLFFSPFWPHCPHRGSQFPDQGSNLHPLQGKHGILMTRLPGKSHRLFLNRTCLQFCIQKSRSCVCRLEL